MSAFIAESTSIKSELRWQVLEKGGFRPVSRGRVTDGTLRIDNVRLEDAGIYSCVRFLGEASDGANQVTVLVSNSETSKFLPAPAVLSIKNESHFSFVAAEKVTKDVGYAVDIQCPLFRISGMTYKWKRVNQPRLPAGAQAEGSVLR